MPWSFHPLPSPQSRYLHLGLTVRMTERNCFWAKALAISCWEEREGSSRSEKERHTQRGAGRGQDVTLSHLLGGLIMLGESLFSKTMPTPPHSTLGHFPGVFTWSSCPVQDDTTAPEQ